MQEALATFESGRSAFGCSRLWKSHFSVHCSISGRDAWRLLKPARRGPPGWELACCFDSISLDLCISSWCGKLQCPICCVPSLGAGVHCSYRTSYLGHGIEGPCIEDPAICTLLYLSSELGGNLKVRSHARLSRLQWHCKMCGLFAHSVDTRPQAGGWTIVMRYTIWCLCCRGKVLSCINAYSNQIAVVATRKPCCGRVVIWFTTQQALIMQAEWLRQADDGIFHDTTQHAAQLSADVLCRVRPRFCVEFFW